MKDAVQGADAVTTDTWVSMGDENERRRHELLKPFQVTSEVMSWAQDDAIFLHCLPAHRDEEVTSEVFDGPQSVVFDEAGESPSCTKRYFNMVFEMIEPANSNFIPFEDKVIPFQLESADVAGRFLRSQHMVTDVLDRHNYPEPIARLLGEALMVLSLIASGMKLRGRMILQIQGDGAVPMLVAEYNADGHVRGYADVNQEMFERWTGGEDVNPFLLLGKGHVALTVDNGAGTQPYQGIVPIDGKSLSAVVLRYIEQSEQIMSSLKIHLDRVKLGDKFVWRGSAMLLQKLGKAGDDFKVSAVSDEENENWDRVCALFNTATQDEMLDPELAPEKLLYRLFHEETVRVFRSNDIIFKCSCMRRD